MTTQTRTGVLSNLGLGVLGGTGGLLSPQSGTLAASFATTFQTFRASINLSAQSMLNSVYAARTSFSALRFGVNGLNAVKDIKIITPASESSGSDEEESTEGSGNEGQL